MFGTLAHKLRFCHLTPLIFGSSPFDPFERRELELEKSFTRKLSHNREMTNFSEPRNDKKAPFMAMLSITQPFTLLVRISTANS